MKKKFLNIFIKIAFSFFSFTLISILLYILSAFSLIYGKVLNVSPFKNFQINFYNQIGYRNIWQAQKECITFDNELIYVPKIGKCIFKNTEFFTELNFTDIGRYQELSDRNNHKSNNIFIIGDSHAMGWGVNDDETFSFLLNKNINIKTTNLAVSSYATHREILRLKLSNLLKKEDLIIIQYSSNDLGENANYKKNINSNKEFSNLINEKLSNFEKIRKVIRYSITIPIEIIFKNEKIVLDWNDHKKFFFDILDSYDFLKDNKIILININSPNIFFKNFINLGENKNLFFLNIDYSISDFFIVDGHLNKHGHIKTSVEIINFIKQNKLFEN